MYLFSTSQVRPSGSNRFNAQRQRSLSTTGPTLRQSAIAHTRATSVDYLRTPHGYASTHCARPTRPLSSLSETDGAWRKNVRTEKERESESTFAGERKAREMREPARTYVPADTFHREKESRLEIIGRYTWIYVGRRSAKDISRSNVETRAREKRGGRTWENKARVDDKSRQGRAGSEFANRRIVKQCTQMRRNARGSATSLPLSFIVTLIMDRKSRRHEERQGSLYEVTHVLPTRNAASISAL